MTKDEIQMPPYLNASFEGDDLYTGDQVRELMKLVAAKEREACARVCEDGVQNATDWDSSYWDQACQNRAEAIRARGQE